MTNKIDTPACLGGLQIAAELSVLIEPLLAGKVSQPDFSFLLPVDEFDVDRCGFCRSSIVEIQLASGKRYFAEIEIDDKGLIRVELARPHICAPSQRFAEFLRSGESEPGDDLS